MGLGSKEIEQRYEIRYIVAILDLLVASEMIIGGKSDEIVISAMPGMFKVAEATWPYVERASLALHNIK